MGTNLAVSVNWAKNDSDLLNNFSAVTCKKPCEWIAADLKPSLFLPWVNPMLSLAPPTTCYKPGCDGRPGPWKTDESYAKHHRSVHNEQAPERVIYILFQSSVFFTSDYFFRIVQFLDALLRLSSYSITFKISTGVTCLLIFADYVGKVFKLHRI